MAERMIPGRVVAAVLCVVLLAGAAGHTYGNNNIWQMWAPGRDPIIGANTPWNQAIDHPGAFQAGHLHRIFESRPWETLVPAQDLLVGPDERLLPLRPGPVRSGRPSV
mgnify:CR=1 FL=1